MILAHRVALNGVQLDELDDRINIKGIEEGAGKETIGAAAMAGGAGQRITNRHRDTVDVTVKFSMLIEPELLQERSALLEKINAWAAGGGYLTVNYKENRRLQVICAQAPGAGDQYEWTSVYTITFRAYALPYWEEETPKSGTSGVSAGGSVAIEVEGSTETDADIVLENRSGMLIENVTINAAGSLMEFESLGLNGGEKLVITHETVNDRRLLKIYIDHSGTKRSAMAMRTPASADDLYVKPGSRTFSFDADRACKMTVNVRGRFV